MTDADVRERSRLPGDEARPVFDVLVAKLRVPATRPGSVRRVALIERLEREVSRPVVSVVASAGYGKTTLLAQWAERSGQAVAWVSVDEQDNDPKVLLGYVARALDEVQPVGQLVFDALASPASSVHGSVVPRLGNAFAEMLVAALYGRSLLAMARGDWSQAEDFASQTRAAFRRPGFEEVSVWVEQARVAAHRGDISAARQALAHTQRLRPLVTYAVAPLAVQVRIELIRVHLALADIAGARTLMREIDEILRRRPDLGILVGQAEELRARLATEGRSPVTASSLTAAELRLLPMLSTHLAAHEIAAEMYLSPHTIKTQAKSIYRKLGAASRSQAVARARELGLLGG